MKKKLLTYMMTAFVMLGCAGLSTTVTAYANDVNDGSYEGGIVTRHDFGTGETYTYYVPGKTAEEAREAFFNRCRRLGMSDADIQAAWESSHGSSGSSSPSAPANTDAAQAESNGAASAAAAPAAPKKPTYTQEQIDAAWEENSRTESTCVVAGSVVYKNSLTGATKSEELPLSEHDYQETKHEEATCTQDGITVQTCSVCGDEVTETTTATGHTAGEAVVTTAAGLFSEGEQITSCTDCGEVLTTEVLPQTCPLPLAAVVGIAVAVVAAIAGGIFAFIKLRKKAE